MRTHHEISVSWTENDVRIMTETPGANPEFLVLMTENDLAYKGLSPYKENRLWSKVVLVVLMTEILSKIRFTQRVLCAPWNGGDAPHEREELVFCH